MIDYKKIIAELFRMARKETKKEIKKICREKYDNEPEKVYRDEPILRPASQMDEDLPMAYREMRNIARSPEALRNSGSWLFYQQGKFIEGLTDDYEFRGDFVRYNPTYQLLTDVQLRGYVTWRTKVRRGEITEAPNPFVYMYIYELLNLIGVESAEEGFRTLNAFCKEYVRFNPTFDVFISAWLCDFAAYYGIDKALANEVCGGEADSAVMILKNTEGRTDDEVFDAICRLSSYKIASSRFAKEYPEDVKAVCRRVYDAYTEVYNKTRKRTLFQNMFGMMTTFPYYRMFSNAVFYDRTMHTDYVYEFNELKRYVCRNGIWSRETYPKTDRRNSRLGEIIKSVDTMMRVAYDYKFPLKFECPTKQLASVIEKVISQYLSDKKKNEAPKKQEIVIDLSKLGGIRAAAEITRDKLIVDEVEDEDEIMTADDPQSADAPTEEESSFDNEAGLDETEILFLRCLLCGGDWRTLVKERKVMLSVLVDSVNEKLYDVLADTAIDFDGVEPRLIEDYVDELKELNL